MRTKKFYPTLLLTFLITGTLDLIPAIILNRGLPVSNIFRFIASGLFGKAAFVAPNRIVYLGALIHYMIAYIFTATWFILYPTVERFRQNKYLNGILFGILTWIIMNFVVVPLSNTPKTKAPLTFYSAGTGILALVLCVGLPTALMASWFYKDRKITATASALGKKKTGAGKNVKGA